MVVYFQISFNKSMELAMQWHPLWTCLIRVNACGLVLDLLILERRAKKWASRFTFTPSFCFCLPFFYDLRQENQTTCHKIKLEFHLQEIIKQVNIKKISHRGGRDFEASALLAVYL